MGKKYKDPPILGDLPNIDFPNDTEFGLLKKSYDIQDNKKLINLLRSNPHLEELMLEAADQISKYFPGVKPVLKYFTDMETIGNEYIIISIPTSFSPQETFEKLDQLEDAWWVENDYRAEGKLSINVEFK